MDLITGAYFTVYPIPCRFLPYWEMGGLSYRNNPTPYDFVRRNMEPDAFRHVKRLPFRGARMDARVTVSTARIEVY